MKRVMKLIDSSNGLMECRICGKRVIANLQSHTERADNKTRYLRGTWQCPNGCKTTPERKFKGAVKALGDVSDQDFTRFLEAFEQLI